MGASTNQTSQNNVAGHPGDVRKPIQAVVETANVDVSLGRLQAGVGGADTELVALRVDVGPPATSSKLNL